VDAASLLACAAYVDLNPIRAAIARTLVTSDHTSVQTRIEAMLSSQELLSEPLTIDEAKDEVGPCVSQTGKRASDKGFLPMTLVDYLQLLDKIVKS
jgi:hypothetical protein